MRKILLASILVIGSSEVAISADAVIDTLPVESAYNWSGAYLGGFIGYGFGDTEHLNPPGETGNLDIDGVIGGVAVGYNYQVDHYVLGVEADIAWSGIDGSHGPALFNTFNCGSGPCETEVNWLATIRGRAGYAFDNILPYVTGGVAIGGVDARIQNAPTLQDGEETQIGWTVGAGIEYGITQQWTAKVEYLYTDLGDWRYDSDGSDFSATAKFSAVKFGVNYRF
ncbi:MAG: porin family protein [Mesorhizobium sp.]|nr:MAG: porin family protein [Mesorhizobium sp.]